MFSALWAIANQAAGAPLGQAAQYLYSMPAGAITDVVPVSSAHNVEAIIQDAAGKTTYSPAETLYGPTPASMEFVSAIYDYPSLAQTEVLISFGTDCTAYQPYSVQTPCSSPTALHTAVGWDDVTGVGTPNALKFVNHFKPAAGASGAPTGQ